jgi:hypothetical protein
MMKKRRDDTVSNVWCLSDRHGYGYVVRVKVLVKAPLTVRSVINNSNSNCHGFDDNDNDIRNNINNNSRRKSSSSSSSGCKMDFHHG